MPKKTRQPPARTRHHTNPLANRLKIKFENFWNKKHVIIDIGSYQWEFGQSLLHKFWNKKNFILFEIRDAFCKYLKDKFQENSNVKVFNGNAWTNIPQVLEKLQKQWVFVEKIFINFPDPWVKKKHLKRRVVNEQFLTDIYPFLDKKTQIIFQTDQKHMFFDTRKLVKKIGTYKIRYFFWPIWGLRTHWEKERRKAGKFIWRMKLIKKIGSNQSRFEKERKKSIIDSFIGTLFYF